MRAPAVAMAMGVVAAAVGVGAARADGPLVDPTRPISTTDSVSAVQAGGVHVQAIVSRARTQVAIVDGRVVRAGDRIADVLIEEVTPEGVRYLQNGQRGFARAPLTKPLAVRRARVPQRDVP